MWLPPRQLFKYQLAKFSVGLIIATIFLGWIFIQWSNVAMKSAVVALLSITIWVTTASIVMDRKRSLGRQLCIRDGVLSITTPTGTTDISVTDIGYGVWHHDSCDEQGLWLFDLSGKSLAHLDTNFLPDIRDALAFVGWARRQTGLPFDVRWPDL